MTALYKPLSFAVGMAGGMLASAIFRQVWKRIAHEEEAPDPTDEFRGWGEVLLAAAIQGAIFSAVRAAVDRGGASSVRRLTGTWPT